MTNKAMKYGLMTMAVVLFVTMAFAGAGAAYDGSPKQLSDSELANYNVLVVNDVSGIVETRIASTLSHVPEIYLLEDVTDWNTVALDETYNGKVLILGDNLDFTGISSCNMMNYQFTGKIYGNGYLIENFTNTSNTEPNVGLIREAGNGAYLNYVQMTNCTLESSNQYVAFLIGLISENSDVTVIGCYVFGGKISTTISNSNGSYVGGIIGRVFGTAEHKLNHSSVFNTTLIAKSHRVGGLVGNAYNIDIENCTVSDCWIEASQNNNCHRSGGVAGNAYFASISNCTVSNCTILGLGNQGGKVGALVGAASNTAMSHCNAINCNIEGTYNLGGIVGEYNVGEINDCIALNCSISGKKTWSGYLGGLFGYVYDSATFKDCTALGCNVINNPGAAGATTGGIIGGMEGDITFINCSAGTDVSTSLYVSSGHPQSGDGNMIGGCTNVSLNPSAWSLTFPDKTAIQNFPATKLPYVYVTYVVNATGGSVGLPYSNLKESTAVPYIPSSPFGLTKSGNIISPIYPGHTFKNWLTPNGEERGTGNVENNEIVKANWTVNMTILELTDANDLSFATRIETFNLTNSSTVDVSEHPTKSSYMFNGWNVSDNPTVNLINKSGYLQFDKEGYTNKTGAWINTALENGSVLKLTPSWLVLETNATVINNVAEFHNENTTIIQSTTETVSSVLLENVSQLTNSTCVNFTAGVSIEEIPDIDGYTKEQITIFEINATAESIPARFNVTVTFADEQTATAEKGKIHFWHYNTTNNAWDTPYLTIASMVQTGGNVLCTVETNSFSPFGIGIYTPIPQQYTPSSSKQTGSTVILQEGQVAPTAYATATPTLAPTAEPTPAIPTVIATEKPTTQATQASPAPFLGILAGLGAAGLFLGRMRR